MTRLRRLAYCLAFLLLAGLSAQESPGIFQLVLPDFSEAPFDGGKSVIELADKPIKRVNILVRNAQQRNLNPGRYRIFVNGKGLGNVFDERTTSDGTLLVMDPVALRKRPDELFDPRENAIEVTGEDRRGRTYYQNWILRTRTDQNALFSYSSSVSAEDANGAAPDLVVTEPAVPLSLKANQPLKVTVKGRLSSGASLAANGQQIVPSRNAEINQFDTAVTVLPDQHELILSAADGKGNKREVRIPVYSPPAGPRPHFAGRKYAILLGISNFGPAKDAPPPIPLAAPDVEELASALEKDGGFRHEDIRLLENDRATEESARLALTDFAAKPQSNDLLLIYLATHGMHDPRPNRASRLFLALYGAQLATLDSTGLALEDLEMYLSRSVHTRHAFVIFDLDHDLNLDWSLSASQNLINTRVLSLFQDVPGWSVLVSGSSAQTGRGRKESSSPSSLFTYWLSKGLGGSADLDGDHVVTASELFAFVAEKVKEDSGATQSPRFYVSESGLNQPISTR